MNILVPRKNLDEAPGTQLRHAKPLTRIVAELPVEPAPARSSGMQANKIADPRCAPLAKDEKGK